MTQRGFVLLLTLILMTALSAIMAALIVSLTTDFRSTATQTNDAKAFWLAEAGLADGVKCLKHDSLCSSGNASFQKNFGDGSYSVTMSKSGNEVTITSVGTVENQSRTVTETQTIGPKFPAAFNYVVFGNNNNNAVLKIGNNNAATVKLSGDLFYNATPGVDQVQVNDNSKVTNGLVYADQVTGGGIFTKATSPPTPVPTYPAFDTTSYDAAIAVADSVPRNNLTLSAGNLNLADGTVYYNAVAIKNGATITGPGTIVAIGGITIGDTASIGQGVDFIGKRNIKIQDSATVASGGSFYARRNIIVSSNATVNSALMLAPQAGGHHHRHHHDDDHNGDHNDDDNNSSRIRMISVEDDAKFTGVIFGDAVRIIGNAIVNGSVVAGKFVNDQIANNAKLTFNSSYLPAKVPNGFTATNSYSLKADSWKEI